MIQSGGGALLPLGHFLLGGAVIVSPTSREYPTNSKPTHILSEYAYTIYHHFSGGSVTISSNNPLDAPIIDPAFLTTQFDIQALRQAVRNSFAFFSAPAWSGFRGDPVPPFNPDVSSDDSIDEFLQQTSQTSFHPVGTAAMSATNAPFGVVNPDLRVKGVVGLRVVDASIMVRLFLFFGKNVVDNKYISW